MTDIYCTDCGSECERVEGSTVSPELAGSWVWSCPVCPASWAKHIDALGGPGDPPSCAATKEARVLLQQRVIDLFVDDAVRTERGNDVRALAQGRVVAWLCRQFGVEHNDRLLGCLDVEGLRRAWKLLAKVDYAVIRKDAVEMKRRPTKKQIAERAAADA